MDVSNLLSAAAAAAGGQQYPAGTLYVVATPIGNLADLTLRAIHVLSLVDAVGCEDTRVSAGLMRHLGLHKPLVALHEHNEREAAAQIVDRLGRGERVAYVSDAGTPAVSDPGAALVAAVQAAGFRALPVPGASSVVTALSVAGDAAAAGSPAGFCFVGFLPARAGERDVALARVVADRRTQVLFEAPHRVDALGRALAQACPARRLTLCRELTKQFESIHTLVAADVPSWLSAEANRARGEFVWVLHAVGGDTAADDERDAAASRVLAVLLRALPLKQAVALAAEISGAPRNALYREALDARGAPEDAEAP